MSYILDALRKAERERQLRRGPSLDAAHAPRRSMSRRPWVWLLTGALAVNGAALGYSLWPPASPVTTAPPAEVAPPAPLALATPAGGGASGAASAVTVPTESGPPRDPSPAPSSPVVATVERADSGPIAVSGPQKSAGEERSARPGSAPEGEGAARRTVEPALSPAAPGRGEPAGHQVSPAVSPTADRVPTPGPRDEAKPSANPAVAPPETVPAAGTPAAAAPPGASGQGPAASPGGLSGTSAAPAPAKAEPPGLRPVGPELTPGFRDAVAKMNLDVLVYADRGEDRFVFINGRKYVEGQTVDGTVVVEGITREGVTLTRQGERFVLRPKSNPYIRPTP